MASKRNESFEEIVIHKGNLIKNNDDHKKYLKKLLRKLNITNSVEAGKVGAIDAMIFDMACFLNYSRWKRRDKREEIIVKLFK